MRHLQQSSVIHFPARRARSIAAVMLPILLFCMMGFPLPIAPRKLVSERFPCENSPCGCLTASHCWDKCCCNNDEQKLAWAERNNVPPPDFLVQRVAAKRVADGHATVMSSCSTNKPQCKCGKQSLAPKQKAAEKQTVCKESPVKTTVSVHTKAKADAELNRALSDDPECEQAPSEVASRFKIVFLHSALECKGIPMAILFFSHAVFTQRVDAHFFDAPRITAWLTLCDESAESYLTCPDGPVPWLFAAV